MEKVNLFGVILAGAMVASGAAMASSETVLASFGDASTGGTPLAGLTKVSGTLYGTTSRGGAYDQGTVFGMTTKGVMTVLYSFGGASGDGNGPAGKLLNVNGNLFGTTAGGGAFGRGSVFELVPPASPGTSWTETVIYSFSGNGDGATPRGGLLNIGGKLYGTTTGYGTGTGGTLFRLTAPVAPATSWTETTLHVFAGGADDGAFPLGNLLDFNGKIYGTTLHGGIGACSDSAGNGCGTVFELTLPGKSTDASERVIHLFDPASGDGSEPAVGLIHAGGKLYGTTVYGGPHAACQSDVEDCGTVYQLTPPVAPDTNWTETVLYAFQGGSGDGSYPKGALISVNGALYGTTEFGGAGIAGSDCWVDAANQGCGTVFKLEPPVAPASDWTESLVYSFGSVGNGNDGATPLAGLVNVSGKFYGTTTAGSGTDCNGYFYPGSYGCGTVFKVVP